MRCRAGATLFEEGDAGETAYVVTSGEIEILKASADQSVRIAISGPGQSSWARCPSSPANRGALGSCAR